MPPLPPPPCVPGSAHGGLFPVQLLPLFTRQQLSNTRTILLWLAVAAWALGRVGVVLVVFSLIFLSSYFNVPLMLACYSVCVSGCWGWPFARRAFGGVSCLFLRFSLVCPSVLLLRLRSSVRRPLPVWCCPSLGLVVLAVAPLSAASLPPLVSVARCFGRRASWSWSLGLRLWPSPLPRLGLGFGSRACLRLGGPLVRPLGLAPRVGAWFRRPGRCLVRFWWPALCPPPPPPRFLVVGLVVCRLVVVALLCAAGRLVCSRFLCPWWCPRERGRVLRFAPPACWLGRFGRPPGLRRGRLRPRRCRWVLCGR